MGKQAAPSGSFEKVNLDPAIQAQLLGQLSPFLNQSQDYQQAAKQAAGQTATDFSQYNPTLYQDFGALNPSLQTSFAPGTELDPLTRATLAQASQASASQLAAQQSNLNQQFAGQPGIAQILGQQARMQSQLQQNPVLFQAQQAQQERANTQAQLQNQARLLQSQQQAALFGLGNQAKLQQAQTGASLQQAGNEALGQRLGFAAQPVNAQQGILATLGSLGSLLGSRYASPIGGGQPYVKPQVPANSSVQVKQ